MTKKIKLLSLILISLVMFVSCGGPKEKKITVSNVQIIGNSSDYIKVIDGDYTLKVEGEIVTMPLKLELIKEYDGSLGDNIGNFSVSLLDNSGVALSVGSYFPGSPKETSDWDKLKTLITSKIGTTMTVLVDWKASVFEDYKDIQKTIMKNANNFEIVSADFTGDKKIAGVSYSKEVAIKDTTGAGEFIFIVKKVTEPSIDRSGLSVTKPEDDEKYIAVDIWVKNISDHEATIKENEFILTDQDGADFVEKNGLTEHRKSPILFKTDDPWTQEVKLQPNEVKSGWVTFTTLKTSKATKIKYKTATVNL